MSSTKNEGNEGVTGSVKSRVTERFKVELPSQQQYIIQIHLKKLRFLAKQRERDDEVGKNGHQKLRVDHRWVIDPRDLQQQRPVGRGLQGYRGSGIGEDD